MTAKHRQVKEFVLLATCTFEAESIDDACSKLARHFHALSIGKPTKLITSGPIDILPTKPKQSFAEFLTAFAKDDAEASKSGVTNIEQLLHGVPKE